VSEVGKHNFLKSKKTLPGKAPIVNAGGYDTIYKLAADPKAELVRLISDNLKATGGKAVYHDEGKIDMLVALLQSKGEGFSSVKVDGEWEEVLSRQGKKSTKRQKIVSGAKMLVRPTSNFNVKSMGFETTVLTPRGNGILKANVKVSALIKFKVIYVWWIISQNLKHGIIDIFYLKSVQPNSQQLRQNQ